MLNVTCDMCWATIKDFSNNTTGAIQITFNKLLGIKDVEYHVCKTCIRGKKRFWIELNNPLYVEEEEKKDEQGN